MLLELCVAADVCVCVGRNAAGKDGSKERLGGSVLDKIPFLHGCQDDDDEDDSDEEDDFQGMATDRIDGQRNKNKKPRVKVPITSTRQSVCVKLYPCVCERVLKVFSLSVCVDGD